MLYDYSICTEPNEPLFFQQCALLEKHVPGLVKGALLPDIDDSLTQLYTKEGKEVIVHNSHYIGALYIDSDIPLEPYFRPRETQRRNGYIIEAFRAIPED